MAKKKAEEAPAGSPAWMATFSDLMNLLLCFFVLLFSMSSVDAAKYDQVVQSLSQAFSIINTAGGVSITQGQLVSSGLSQLPEFSNYFGDTMSDGKNTKEGAGETGSGTSGEDESEEHGSTEFPEEGISQDAQMTEGAVSEEEVTGGTISDEEIPTEEAIASYEQQELSESERMAQEIEALTVQYGIQDLVQVDFNGQYVRITLNGALLFDSGSAELAQEALPLVEKIAKIIDVYSDSIVEIEGHTDNVPIHSSKFESNDVLSMYRALYVADYVRGISVIDPSNIISSGRGSYVPIADNATAEGRARNRRVEVKIYNSFNSQEAAERAQASQSAVRTEGGNSTDTQTTDEGGAGQTDDATGASSSPEGQTDSSTDTTSRQSDVSAGDTSGQTDGATSQATQETVTQPAGTEGSSTQETAPAQEIEQTAPDTLDELPTE